MVSRDSKPQDAETESGEGMKEPVINLFDGCVSDYMDMKVPSPESGLRTLRQMTEEHNANLPEGKKALSTHAMKYWVDLMVKDKILEKVGGLFQQNPDGGLRKVTYYQKVKK